MMKQTKRKGAEASLHEIWMSCNGILIKFIRGVFRCRGPCHSLTELSQTYMTFLTIDQKGEETWQNHRVDGDGDGDGDVRRDWLNKFSSFWHNKWGVKKDPVQDNPSRSYGYCPSDLLMMIEIGGSIRISCKIKSYQFYSQVISNYEMHLECKGAVY